MWYIYAVRYWGQLINLLNIILELKDQQNGDERTCCKVQEEEKEEEEEEEEMTILTRDFDILCEYVIPIKEQSVRLFDKKLRCSTILGDGNHHAVLEKNP